MKVKWKGYEYIHTPIQGSSAKRIDLQEEEFFVIDVLQILRHRFLNIPRIPI